MTYYCDIVKMDGWYVPQFPDMTNVSTCAETAEQALVMAKEALNLVIEVDLDHNYPIPLPQYTGGYPIEVSTDLAERIRARDLVSA